MAGYALGQQADTTTNRPRTVPPGAGLGEATRIHDALGMGWLPQTPGLPSAEPTIPGLSGVDAVPGIGVRTFGGAGYGQPSPSIGAERLARLRAAASGTPYGPGSAYGGQPPATRSFGRLEGRFGDVLPPGVRRMFEYGRASAEQGTLTNLLLMRPQMLAHDNAFTAPVRKLRVRNTGPESLNVPAQSEVNEALERIRSWDPEALGSYGDMLSLYISGYWRRFVAEGWDYLRAEDYRQALYSFETAGMLDPDSAIPQMGQLVAMTASGQYRRAVRKLETIVSRQSSKPEWVEDMFEYPVASLRRLFSKEDKLLEMIASLRRRAQTLRPEDRNRGIEALYCYILWYSGYEDAVIEAKSIAARIHDNYPRSIWASFHGMILEAERRRAEAAAARAAAKEGASP